MVDFILGFLTGIFGFLRHPQSARTLFPALLTVAHSAMSDSASSTNAQSPETKHKSWADEAEEEVPEETNWESSTASVSSLDVGKLAIDENKKTPSKLLDEPDDANIKAVTISTWFSLFKLCVSPLEYFNFLVKVREKRVRQFWHWGY